MSEEEPQCWALFRDVAQTKGSWERVLCRLSNLRKRAGGAKHRAVQQVLLRETGGRLREGFAALTMVGEALVMPGNPKDPAGSW